MALSGIFGRRGKGKSGAAGVAAAGGTAIVLNTARVGFFRGLASKASLILSGGILAQLPSLFSSTDESEKDFTNELNRASITKPEILPLSITAPDSDVNISAATLAFTKFVNDQADSAETIKPISEKLPELLPSKKYSPLFSAIIENINGIKERLHIVEEKAEQQNAILSNLKTASMSLNTVVKEEMENDRQFARETKRKIKEEKLERPGIAGLKKAGQFVYDNTFRKAGDYVSGIKDLVISFIKQFALPAGLIALGGMVELAKAAGESGETAEGASDIGVASQGLAAFTGASAALSAIRNPRTMAQINSLISQRATSTRNLRNTVQRTKNLKTVMTKIAASENFFIKNGLRLKTFATFMASIGIFFELKAIAGKFEKGDLTEEQYEKRAKAQLTILVEQLGGPLIVSYIGGIVAGKIGSVAGPYGILLGALIGGTIGFAYGDDLMRQYGVSTFVNVLYDFLLGRDDSILALWKAITSTKIYNPEELRQQGYGENITPAQMMLQGGLFRRVTDETGEFSPLRSAATLAKFDDRAIFTAFADVDTPQGYYEIKHDMESKLKDDTTMEDFIAKVLPETKTGEFVQRLATAMRLNPENTEEDINVFLNDIATNSEIFKAAMPDAYALVQKGQAIPITLSDGTRTVLSYDEVQSMENISDMTRSNLIETLDRQQRNYRRYLEREARSNSFMLPPSLSDKLFDENRPTVLNFDNDNMSGIAFNQAMNRGVSVIPLTVPMMIPQGTGRGSINHSLPQPAKPSPTISTTDPFIDMRYVT